MTSEDADRNSFWVRKESGAEQGPWEGAMLPHVGS